MNVASFFAGAGGMDRGFENAGFNVVYANEFDKKIQPTYLANHNISIFDDRSIIDVKPEDIPEIDGIIGGPPCQSWSLAGSMQGINDNRGRLFFNFINLINAKKPLFFVAENVIGILSKRNEFALQNIIENMSFNGTYTVKYQILNAADYSTCQDRKRVFFIGIRNDLNIQDESFFPEKQDDSLLLSDVIYDLRDSALPTKGKTNQNLFMNAHEYLDMDFSSMYMSRNRCRLWNEKSFTIQATGRHIPLHPDSGRMTKIGKDKFSFPEQYRRLSVRECARIQTFDDDFMFLYNNINDGYKMVGNAVPVKLAEAVANQIKKIINQRK